MKMEFKTINIKKNTYKKYTIKTILIKQNKVKNNLLVLSYIKELLNKLNIKINKIKRYKINFNHKIKVTNISFIIHKIDIKVLHILLNQIENYKFCKIKITKLNIIKNINSPTFNTLIIINNVIIE